MLLYQNFFIKARLLNIFRIYYCLVTISHIKKCQREPPNMRLNIMALLKIQRICTKFFKDTSYLKDTYNFRTNELHMFNDIRKWFLKWAQPILRRLSFGRLTRLTRLTSEQAVFNPLLPDVH